MDGLFPAHFAARVAVKTTDGRTVEHTIVDPHGTPSDPCTFEEIESKFSRLASGVKGSEAIEAIRNAARMLGGSSTIEAFSRALRDEA
jgi:2-methylcitrate dehydratase PrpD